MDLSSHRLALPLALLALVACADESSPEASVADQDESRPGQDLVSCRSEADPNNRGTTLVTCSLAADGGALRVRRAGIVASDGSSGWSGELTPEEPTRTVFASNVVRDLKLTIDVDVDASDVLGLDDFRVEESIAAKPEALREGVRVRAPFETWRVALVADEVPITEASLEPWTVQLGGRSVTIDGELPDVALGEKATVHLAIQSAEAREGTAKLGVGEAATEAALTIDGPGAYLARAGGFEPTWAPNGDLPSVLACWIEGEELLCQAPEDPVLAVVIARIGLTRADGTRSGKTVVVNYEPVRMQVIDDETGEEEVFDDASARFRVAAVGASAFPARLEADVSVSGAPGAVRTGRDGAVVGLDGSDPFSTNELRVDTTIASAHAAPAEGPIEVSLPFDLWKITLVVGEPGAYFQGAIDAYDVHLGVPWAGKDVGAAIRVGGSMPSVADMAGTRILEQTFYLPVEPGHTAPLGGTMSSGAEGAFSFPGPGRYVATQAGITRAP